MPPSSDEDAFIARHFAPFAGPGALGLRDDAALIAPPSGCELVVTTDAIVAGVHFFPDDLPGDIARKALRVNLSDLAAKGAEPHGFVLSLALPPDWIDGKVAAFAFALGEDAKQYGCALLGGDTVSTPGPLTISLTAFGTVPQGRMVRRDGARAREAIFVSSTIGDAALGLLVAQGDARLAVLGTPEREHLLGRYRRPQPRTALSIILRAHATAAMDVSDGLAGDLAKMLSLAGLSAHVRAEEVPLSAAARAVLHAAPDLWETVLTGGDDYEILCTVPPERAAQFAAEADKAGIPVTRIGGAEEGGETRFTRDERPLIFARSSWSHL